MHKVVLDTNVIISACISSVNAPGLIIDKLFFEDKITLCLSQDVLDEYLEVLKRPKFQKMSSFSKNAQKFVHHLHKSAEWYNPQVKYQDAHDADDNIFLELVVEASADFLITGNLKDFPTPDFKNIPIVSPSEYWTAYQP